MPLKLLSINVNGLNSPRKRTVLLGACRREKADIAFLQETHLTGRHTQLQGRWFSQTFFASATCKKRGVAILIRRNIPFVHSKTIIDPEGRFLIVMGTIRSQSLTLVSVYAPNQEQPLFFDSLFKRLDKVAQGHIILGGDFNAIIDPTLDRTTPPSRTPTTSLPRASRTLIASLKRLGLCDSWRLHHPHAKDFTHYSAPHQH